MIRNIGTADKIIRIALAIIVAGLYAAKQINGTAAIFLGGLAIILVATSLIGFCPLYFPFKISTLKKN